MVSTSNTVLKKWTILGKVTVGPVVRYPRDREQFVSISQLIKIETLEDYNNRVKKLPGKTI